MSRRDWTKSILCMAALLGGCAEEEAIVKPSSLTTMSGDAGGAQTAPTAKSEDQQPLTGVDAGTSDVGSDAGKPTAQPDASQQADAGAAQTATVEIADGTLVGVVEGSTRKFLGIPYAKPPVGELRWRRPQPNDPWTEPRDATKFGKRCAQVASAVLQNAASEDEDCLYLNVWTPAAPAAQPLPVMVWIHGGGNVNGSASEPLPYVNSGVFYSGHKLAERGVVVVTLNYRLGVFGFFAHPDLAAEDGGRGNQGLLDQTRALEWVRDNIAKFGGDPKRVTIFGESAGSQDVCLHVASPHSRGLFHAAISQSGGSTTRTPTREQAEASAQTLASALGCDEGDALACLRAAPVAKLLAPGITPAPSFGPIVDGDFMPDQPRNLFDEGAIADVPYLLGSNTDEGTLFTPPAAQVPDEAALRAIVASQFGGPESAERILEVYPPDQFASPRAALARIIGDARLVCTTYDTAVRAAQRGRNVWLYNFDQPSFVPGIPSTQDLGATHGAELVYVFGTSTLFNAETGALADLMQRYWVGFATNEDPNGADRLHWPALTESQDERLNFAAAESKLVPNFRGDECAFWRTRYDAQFR